jgi:hypothetical protein
MQATQDKWRKTSQTAQGKAKGARQSPQFKAMHMEQSKGKCAKQGKQNAQEKQNAYLEMQGKMSRAKEWENTQGKGKQNV